MEKKLREIIDSKIPYDEETIIKIADEVSDNVMEFASVVWVTGKAMGMSDLLRNVIQIPTMPEVSPLTKRELN